MGTPRNLSGSNRRNRRWRWLPLLTAGLAAADWIGLKWGFLGHPLWVLGILVALTVALLVLHLGGILWDLRLRRRRPGVGLAQGGAITGVIIALAAGLANWLLSLQGFVVLHEGEAVPLHGGSHLQQFDEGPLARLEEMELVLGLVEVDLAPEDDGSVSPRSLLEVHRAGDNPTRLMVSPHEEATHGSLRFFQGAFGFAPRVVLLREDKTVFDQVVPFTTVRPASPGYSFAGSLMIEEEDVRIDGVVDLSSLDETLRGHATLRLSVAKNGELLGHGSLLPGHFAEIKDGYRIGFTGLQMWSEIDVARRHYGELVMGGAVVALAGLAAWPVAAWRRW